MLGEFFGLALYGKWLLILMIGSFAGRIRVNLAKNRYTDVLCYDHSRVILSQIDDEPTSDYINANFVDGYKQRNAYISTQGTCDGFIIGKMVERIAKL